jgi:hypothetical protein
VLAVVALEADGPHPDQVDDAFVVGLETDRELHQHRVQTQLVAQLLGHARRIGAGAIELVDERQPRHPVTAHLPVDRHGLGLNAGHTAQHQDGAVEHAQGALHLDGEVHVPGRVDDVDVVVVPAGVGGRGGDRDPPLLLQLHVVHGRPRPLLAAHLLDPVDAIGVEEDPLGQGGLPRVDVGGNPDVSKVRKVLDHDGGAI